MRQIDADLERRAVCATAPKEGRSTGCKVPNSLILSWTFARPVGTALSSPGTYHRLDFAQVQPASVPDGPSPLMPDPARLLGPSKLPAVGTTIFTVMSQLALEHRAVNLGQGFPDFDCDPQLKTLVSEAMQQGHNQYAPMAGLPLLREAISEKVALLYGRRYRSDAEIT